MLNKRDALSLASALLSPALRVASFSLFSHPPFHSILPGPRENHLRHSLSLDALPHPQGMALADLLGFPSRPRGFRVVTEVPRARGGVKGGQYPGAGGKAATTIGEAQT